MLVRHQTTPQGRTSATKLSCAGILTLCLTLCLTATAASPGEILERSGVQGGVVVVLGCEHPGTLVDFRPGDSYVVQGLDTSPDNVARVKRCLAEEKLTGPLSARVLDGKVLPYAEEMVNLLIVRDDFELSGDEMERVLVPGGVLMRRQDGRWHKRIKPWPEQIDDWGHFLHDSANTGVSRDRRVGPPRKIKWLADPLWTRSHEAIRSVAAIVSAGGRVFSVVDEKAHESNRRLPTKWRLVARDAFNGVLLWKRELPHWQWPVRTAPPFGHALGSAFTLNHPQSLVTDGERVYLFTGDPWTLTVVDAATGEIVKSIDTVRGSGELVCADGLLVASFRPPKKQAEPVADRRRQPELSPPELAAIRTGSWEILWRTPAPGLRDETLTLHEDRVFYQSEGSVVALKAKDGGEIWRKPAPGELKKGHWKMWNLVGTGDLLLASLSRAKDVTAFDTATGQIVWNEKIGAGRAGPFPIGAELYCATRAFDLKTGAPERSIETTGFFSKGHHFRCYPWKATERFLISSNRGCEFLPVNPDDLGARNDYIRGTCGFGVVPANGLLYVPPCSCFCYNGVMQDGFKALAAGEARPVPVQDATSPARLEKGPAYDRPLPSDDDSRPWPMYRRDPRRLGASESNVGPEVQVDWKASPGGSLTPPILADGLLFAADKDAHRVLAFNANDGRPVWTSQTDARIDSPPTFYRGRILFGCADGYAYCLDAKDGQLAWRFRAAPRERWIGAFGQIESAWPVHGSVLVEGGVAYLTAGRNTWFDGGIHLYALDPTTGRVLYYRLLKDAATAPGVETPPVVDRPVPGYFEGLRKHGYFDPYVPGHHCEGARSVLLVSDGQHLYLGPIMLDKELNVIPAPYMEFEDTNTDTVRLTGAPWVDQSNFRRKTEAEYQATGALKGNLGEKKMPLHLLATGGFLDGRSHERHYWMYAKRWPGYYHASPYGAKSGQLLVIDDDNVYGVQIFGSRVDCAHSPSVSSKGQLIFAEDIDNEPVLHDDARGRDKGMGYTRAAPPKWHRWERMNVRAMTVAGNYLFVAGPALDKRYEDPFDPYEGRAGSKLVTLNKDTGDILSETELGEQPVFDGLVAAGDRLYATTLNGNIICVSEKQ